MARTGTQARLEAGDGGVTQRDEVRSEPGAEELWTGRTPEVSDYIERNREAWERWAPGYAAIGRQDWSQEELCWGLWRTPETELLLVEDLNPGADVIELGCGTGGLSAWLTRRGLKVVGIDFSRRQLDTAQRLQREFDLALRLIRANVEQVPFDFGSFDLVISEYGASLWCDPREWLPEAHRLLRPGGRLVFVVNSTMLMACTHIAGGLAGERLVRESFGSHRVEFPNNESVEFHLTHGRWFNVLHAAGFEIEDLIEVQPPPTATPRYELASVEWARKWPSEEIWVARKV